MARLPVDMEINAVITQINIDHAAERRLTDQYNRAMAGPGFITGTTRDQYAAAQGRSQRGGMLPMLAKSAGMESLFTTIIPAISALTGVLVMAVSNSKIVATVMSTVGKALGLLVDLVLMPFLPIIMWVLIKLFGAIIAFGKIWKEGVDKLKPAIDALAKAMIPSGPTNYGSLAGAAIAGIVVAVATALLLGLGGAILASPALVAIGTLLAAAIVGLLVAGILYYLLPASYELGKKAGRWIADVADTIQRGFGIMGTYVGGIINTIMNGFGIMLDKVKGFFDMMRNGFGILGDKISLIIRQLLWRIINFAHNLPLIGHLVGDPGGYPTAATGGYVERSGVAIIHKGETIVPSGGGNTFNFYGYQDDQFIKKVKDVLRSQGAGYNQ